MKFSKIKPLVLLLIIIASIFLVISDGSNNTPLRKQNEFDEVSLTDDPAEQQPFNFDFDLPSIDIPIISGTFGLGGTGLWIIFFIFLLMVLILITSMIVSQRRKRKGENEEKEEIVKDKEKELEIRRQTLGKRIGEIISFLENCLDGRFSQGITEGFERLDIALKEYSKISRPGWLTLREFTLLRIPYFNHDAMITAVEKFYRITYGQKPAIRNELEEFIVCFKLMIADEKVLKWKADSPPILEGDK
ncbi:MAG: hypothetical protein ACXADY_07025 [Candidatus Hodarchaeales archaeon]|jgi:hypothetical protein